MRDGAAAGASPYACRVASCGRCGRAYGPGDRRCASCGADRTTSAPSTAGLPAGVEIGVPASVAELVGPAGSTRADAAYDAPASLHDDGSLRVEVLEHDGHDLLDRPDGHGERAVGTETEGDVHVGGGRGRWLRRAALAGLAVAALVGAGAAVRREQPTLTVQLTGGTLDVAADHVRAPTARWTYALAEGTTLAMATQDDLNTYLVVRSRQPGAAKALSMSVVALDAATGAVRWTYDITASDVTAHPTIKGLIVNVQDGRTANASMLDPADGAVRWQVDGFVTQAPDEPGTGIVQQLNGRFAVGLQVIDLHSGAERWTPAGSLRTGLGLGVVVDASCDEIAGREASSGIIRWRFPALDGASFCTRGRAQLAVAAGRVVVADGDDLVGIDAHGQERWRRPLGSQVLAGSNGPYVWLREQDAATVQTFVNAATGVDVDAAGTDLILRATRDRTVVARAGDAALVLLDEAEGLVRADPGTGQRRGLAMPGSGAVGLGRTTVYRTTVGGGALVGYALATGRPRWSVPLGRSGGAGGRVWTAGRTVLVGADTGTLTAFG